eukprot:GFUD01038285.1.p1 GENE.GFUD01038285.1~~GFUD01038285.1.p1  ORF type:complete len:856 (-),score=258.96 GFUD01038285.1:138-2705(-)
MQTSQGLGLVTLLMAGVCQGAPGWGIDNSYEDIMKAFGTFKPPFKKFDSMMGDFGNTFDQNMGIMGRQFEDFGENLGDQFENVGSKMEQQFENVGNQFGQHMSSVGSNLGQHMSSAGNNLDVFGSQLENSFNHQFGNFENNMDVLGTNLMSHFDNQLGNLPFGHNVDVFGMFGRSRTPWWKKENVCVEREVLEEEDKQPTNIDIISPGNTNFHLQVNQCVEGEDYYECTNTVAEDGSVKTLKATYSCCHGFQKAGRGPCTQVDLKSLDETMEDIGGKEFLNLVVENELESMLSNVTIFVPNDEAVEDFKRDMEELSSFTQAENVVYSIDDGLIYRRKKRSILILEQPELPDIVAGHIVKGFVNTKDFRDEELLTSENTENDQIRITFYPTQPEKTIMANCAKVTSKDNHAINGVVHMVDKVILPAKNTVSDILATDLQFQTFQSALEANNLSEMLAKPGHFTVFAPTDEAFEKLDELTREKVLGNGGCAKDIIQSHILPNVICSGIVENKVKISNMLGRDMLMSRDEDGNILVEGIKLMMKDKMATNGVIHVIEDVIIQKSVMSVIDHLKKKNSHKLLNLLEKTGLTKTVENLSNLTFFAPSEKAISEIPKALMDELVKDGKKLEEILLHHIATEKKGSCHLSNNQHLDTAGGQKLRINLHKHFGHRHALGTVQCARIIENDENVCGGKIHTIDRVLTPPSGNVFETLKKDHSQFLKLIEFAGIENELSAGLHTILAPLDSAFDKLDDDIKSKIFEEKEVADSVVRNHIIADALCCAGVPRISGFFQMSLGKRSNLGEEISIRRSNGGHIYANQAAVVRCDLAATNGVVHSVDALLLPMHLQKSKGTNKKKFWMF